MRNVDADHSDPVLRRFARGGRMDVSTQDGAEDARFLKRRVESELAGRARAAPLAPDRLGLILASRGSIGMERLIAGHLGIGGPAQARAPGKVDLVARTGRDLQGRLGEDGAHGVEEPGLAPGRPGSGHRRAHDQEAIAVALQPGESGHAVSGVQVTAGERQRLSVEAVCGDDGNSKAEGKGEEGDGASDHAERTSRCDGGLGPVGCRGCPHDLSKMMLSHNAIGSSAVSTRFLGRSRPGKLLRAPGSQALSALRPS